MTREETVREITDLSIAGLKTEDRSFVNSAFRLALEWNDTNDERNAIFMQVCFPEYVVIDDDVYRTEYLILR